MPQLAAGAGESDKQALSDFAIAMTVRVVQFFFDKES